MTVSEAVIKINKSITELKAVMAYKRKFKRLSKADQDCMSQCIRDCKKKNPDMKQDQIIAICYEKCSEK